ncbi:alpha-amylase family glycosyl hydrolase [Mycoplasma sp. CB776]
MKKKTWNKSLVKFMIKSGAFPLLSYSLLTSCTNTDNFHKDFSFWGDKQFYKDKTNKLSYKEDDENAKLVAPLVKNEKNSSVIYQVLVYSFADGNNDGIGDFIGLKNNLDYFTNLGIDQLYLSPIHPASSYHGYDVIDYTDVAAELGGKEAFLDFLKEAHKKGIKVYLDLVFNHTSFEHPWFQKALEGDSKYKNFYRFYSTKIQDTNQDSSELRSLFPNLKDKHATNKFYTSKFWAGMPDLNLDNPEVIEELKHIQSYWTKIGVDGFRYDAFAEFFSSMGETKNNYNEQKIFSELRKSSQEALQSQNLHKDIFMMGEWLDDALKATVYFNYNNEKALGTIYDGKHWKENWFVSINKDDLNNQLTKIGSHQEHPWVPFLTNHDTDRWINSFRVNMPRPTKDPETFDSPLKASELNTPLSQREKDAIRNAYFYLLILPSTPIIYHGDELMMHANKTFGDPGIREPFKWKDTSKRVEFKEKKSLNDYIHLNFSKDTPYVEDQVKDKNSIYSIIKFLLDFRSKHPFMYSQDLETIGDASNYLENTSDQTIIRQSKDKQEKYLFINTVGINDNINYKLKDGVEVETIYSYNSKVNNKQISIGNMGLIILKIK